MTFNKQAISKGVISATFMRCPTCSGPIIFNYHAWLFKCKTGCNISLKAHPDGRPMGKIADGLTRFHRYIAHEDFDALWKNIQPYELKNEIRLFLYDWLAERLGIKKEICHIGNFNEVTCQKVSELCDGNTVEFILKGLLEEHKKNYPEKKVKMAARGIYLPQWEECEYVKKLTRFLKGINNG